MSGQPGEPGRPGEPGFPGTGGGGYGGAGGLGGAGGRGGMGVSAEEHVLLMFRVGTLEAENKELKASFNKLLWMLIGTIFTVTGALIIAALVSLSTQGRI